MSSAGKKIKLSTQLDSGTQYETYDLVSGSHSLINMKVLIKVKMLFINEFSIDRAPVVNR
jgi:hypothetical protein